MKSKAFSLVFSVLFVSLGWSVSHGQVTTAITSSGLGTAVSPISPSGVVTITGGTRPGSGPNLFHSFGLFSVGAADTANFFNDTGLATTNILSRVTGGNPSNIFGIIKTTDFGNANLFLINPAGVIFGSSASLDIGGSFHVSTADYVRMFDGTNSAYFYANSASDGLANSVLSSAPPVDFGFLSPQAFGFTSLSPESITIDGSALSVPAGQSLSVVGGDIAMTGGALNAPGGQINLVSVASPGEILLSTLQTAPNVNGDPFSSFGTINMSQGVTLDVSDYGFEVDGRAGTVLIRGGQLVMDSAFMFAFTVGDTDGATTGVNIDATGDVQLSNLSLINTDTFGMGRSGDIVLNARNLDVRDLSFINTHSGGAGPAGNVTVTASGAVTVTGTDGFGNFSNISSVADSGGDSGTVTIHAASVTLDEGAQIRTQSVGHAGGITLDASGDVNVLRGSLVEIDGSSGGSSGTIAITGGGTVTISGQLDLFTTTIRNVSDTAPANISINAANFLLTDGAQINAQTSTGTNGMVAIAASESAAITGGSEIINATAAANGGSLELSAPTITIGGGLLSVRANSSGDAGALTVIATGGDLTVSGGSVISSGTFSSGHGGPVSVSASGSVFLSEGSTIESRSTSSGPAGTVTVNAGNVVSLSGSGTGLLTETSGSGRGGDIAVQGNQVQLADGATISASSTGTGNAGNITVTSTDSLVMQNQSSITTGTTQSDGGDIHIQAGHLVQLTGSTITTSVQGGLGNGGNITIDPEFVVLQGSQVIANAFGGNGGNISIVAGVFFADPTSTISASSTLGVSGTVDIQAPVTNLSGTLAPLPTDIVQAAALLQARCAARLAGGTSSSFVVAGRDGVPLEPGAPLTIPLFAESTGGPRQAGSLNLPGLRVGRTFGDPDLALTALNMGCAS